MCIQYNTVTFKCLNNITSDYGYLWVEGHISCMHQVLKRCTSQRNDSISLNHSYGVTILIYVIPGNTTRGATANYYNYEVLQFYKNTTTHKNCSFMVRRKIKRRHLYLNFCLQPVYYKFFFSHLFTLKKDIKHLTEEHSYHLTSVCCFREESK